MDRLTQDLHVTPFVAMLYGGKAQRWTWLRATYGVHPDSNLTAIEVLSDPQTHHLFRPRLDCLPTYH
jgi:hypothetical protein